MADNGSSDDSVSFLEDFQGVDLIQLDNNYGFTGGYNKALSKVSADIYILLNSDVKVTSSWITPITNFLKKIQNTQRFNQNLDYKRPSYFEYAGAAGGFIDSLGYPYCRDEFLRHLKKILVSTILKSTLVGHLELAWLSDRKYFTSWVGLMKIFCTHGRN